MKTGFRVLKLLISVSGSAIAAAAAFGQTTYTWTGAADGTNFTTPGNWNPVGLPNGTFQDTAQWDGVTTSNLVISYGAFGLPGTGFATLGINLVLTANQTNSIQIISSVAQSANMAINNITINGPGGALNLGGGVSTDEFVIIGRPAGATHDWINNSTNPAVVAPNVGFQAGGGTTYTIVFDGSGDWLVTNSLANANNTGSLLAKLGTGTWFWNGPSTPGLLLGNNSPINSPMTLNGGTVILQWNNTKINNVAIQNNGTLLEYDAPLQSQTLNGVISGIGALQVNNGTLTLGGQNTYYGTNILSGGELIVNGAENAGVSGPLGVGGLISFNGGTFGFSVNNGFDYSSRFSTAAGQAYSFDTGGQSVTFATGLNSSGGTLTKAGAGTLTLTGTSTYSGLTTVSAGKLVFQGSKTGSGAITVADSAALGVTENGSQITPATLTLGTSSDCTLEFNNVNSTTLAPLAAGTLSSAGTVTININSGTFAPGNCYPLLTWTNSLAPTVSLGMLNGAVGYLSISGHTLYLCITSVALVWTGVNSGNWTDPNNWTQTGIPIMYFDPSPAVFDDTASGTTTVIVDAPVHPASVTVNNSTKTYSITSSGANDIGGITGLTKNGSGLLMLAGGANTYTGITTISGGTVSVGTLANGGSASDIGAASSSAANLVLNGGMLLYTGGGVSIDRRFTLGTGGGTIDASGIGELVLNNVGSVGYSGNGARGLNLAGNNTGTNTLTAVLADNGGATSLTKSGAGAWVVTANNTYSGGTTINAGTLQVGAGGASGSLGSGNIVHNGTLLDFNRTGSLTVNGAISGTGPVTLDGSGTVILAANNTYGGLTTINAGTLQLGTGGASGTVTGTITNNGTLVFNSSGTFTLGFPGISGTGNIIKQGTGLQKIIGNNTYTGWTRIDPGATLQVCEGNQGQLLTSVITNNGTLRFVRQDFGVFFYTNLIVGSGIVQKDVSGANAGDVTLTGDNPYTNVTYIAYGSINLGDGTNTTGTIGGNVVFTNNIITDAPKMLTFNHPNNITFGHTISGPGSTVGGYQGILAQIGTGVLTLTANNSYAGITVISNGTLQVGAGGTSGSLGTNNTADFGALVFNRSDAVTFGGGITGTGTVVQAGSSTLTLTGVLTQVDTNNLAVVGTTTVSNGTLVITSTGSSVLGNLNVSGGTLVPGAVGTIRTLSVAGNMNIVAGTVSVTVNKSLTPSNSLFSVTNAITYTGGTLKVVNAGPGLVVGDKFTIFSQPVTGGAAMPIVSLGVNFASNLAVDGSVSVSAVASAPTITATSSGGNVILSWPAIWTGLHLQCQTNPLTKGLGTNWVTMPGTDASNSYLAPLNTANATVFYRLAP